MRRRTLFIPPQEEEEVKPEILLHPLPFSSPIPPVHIAYLAKTARSLKEEEEEDEEPVLLPPPTSQRAASQPPTAVGWVSKTKYYRGETKYYYCKTKYYCNKSQIFLQ